MATEPFLSQIALFSFNYAPKGWALCNGQFLPINQNQALFSLLGTTYGGDGKVNFALPDLRGRVPLAVSDSHFLGEKQGSETLVVAENELPAHTHALDVTTLTATAKARNSASNLASPVGNTPAILNAGSALAYSNAAPDASMQASSVAFGGAVTAGNAGSSPPEPHENRQPYLVMNYCIALQGIFPSPN